MLRITAILLLFAVGAVNSAAAELPGRFVFEKVPEGYLRLDTATGAVSLCAAKGGIWSCSGLSDDMAELRAENSKLRARVEELEKSRFSIALPSDQDIDKLLEWFGKMADRFVEFSRRMERKGAS